MSLIAYRVQNKPGACNIVNARLLRLPLGQNQKMALISSVLAPDLECCSLEVCVVVLSERGKEGTQSPENEPT